MVRVITYSVDIARDSEVGRVGGSSSSSDALRRRRVGRHRAIHAGGRLQRHVRRLLHRSLHTTLLFALASLALGSMCRQNERVCA